MNIKIWLNCTGKLLPVPFRIGRLRVSGEITILISYSGHPKTESCSSMLSTEKSSDYTYEHTHCSDQCKKRGKHVLLSLIFIMLALTL